MAAWAGIAVLLNRGNVNYPTKELHLKYCILYSQNWPFPWYHFGLFSPADFFETTCYLCLPSHASGKEVCPAVTPVAVDRRSSCACCLLSPYRSSPSLCNFEFHFVPLLCFRYKSPTAGICCLLHYKASGIICEHCTQFCRSSVNNAHGCCAPSESETWKWAVAEQQATNQAFLYPVQAYKASYCCKYFSQWLFFTAKRGTFLMSVGDPNHKHMKIYLLVYCIFLIYRLLWC